MAGEQSSGRGAMKFRYGPIWLLGFGLLGIEMLWAVYNANVPLFLQAGRPDFAEGAGLRGYALSATANALVMALDNLAAMLILPFIGALSDRTRTRWGRRKPFVLLGAPIAALAFALLPFAVGRPLALFMALVMLTLIAMDFFRSPVVALMPDLTPPEKRSPANGVINVMAGIGTVLGFLAGEWLWHYSPAAPFAAVSVGMLMALGLVLLLVVEPEVPESGEEQPPLLASLLAVCRDRDRSALLLLGAILFWFLGFAAIQAFFTSFAMDDLRLAPGPASGLAKWFPLSILAFALPAGLIGQRTGRRAAIMTGIVLFAAAMAWGFTLRSVELFPVMLTFAGCAWSLIVVNSLPLVLDFSPAGREGTYTGLYYLASQAAAVLGPLLAGVVVERTGNDYRMLFLYGPVTLAVALVLMLGVRRGERAGPP